MSPTVVAKPETVGVRADGRSTPESATDHRSPQPAHQPETPTGLVDYVEDELLLEEISIDGMCGVY